MGENFNIILARLPLWSGFGGGINGIYRVRGLCVLEKCGGRGRCVYYRGSGHFKAEHNAPWLLYNWFPIITRPWKGNPASFSRTIRLVNFFEFGVVSFTLTKFWTRQLGEGLLKGREG